LDKLEAPRDRFYEQYPQSRLGDYIKGGLEWRKAFFENPSATKESWARCWAKRNPMHFVPKAAGKEDRPPTWTGRGG
jgi:hypothetical protein